MLQNLNSESFVDPASQRRKWLQNVLVLLLSYVTEWGFILKYTILGFTFAPRLPLRLALEESCCHSRSRVGQTDKAGTQEGPV